MAVSIRRAPGLSRSRQSQRQSEWLAWVLSALTVVLLALLIYVGSRELRDFDSALVGYAVGTVFAAGAVVYRYTLWLSRPPTGRYFRAGVRGFFSWRNFRRYTLLVPVALWTDIFAQTFILKRSFVRWLMHMCIFWGVLLSLAITIPLTFGWIRFTLEPPLDYRLWVFGFETVSFPLETVLSWVIFHALDFTAVILLVGVGIAFWRRSTDAGLLTTQRFGWDVMPLVLLAAIAITGLALTASSVFWHGAYYWFISLTHQAVVVTWLLLLPFGKFFHIVERPATIGVTLYQAVNQGMEHYPGARRDAGACRRCGQELPSPQFVADLQATLSDLGQSYALSPALGALQEYCPACKRQLRGRAYFERMGKQFL
ncbi:MAG: MFS transporter [Dehalococcoidia bacterium]|nr:MFS transporter [Dehalococcoidia bacterium]